MMHRIRAWLSAKEYVSVPGNRSVSDNGAYIAAVQAALLSPKVFARFKKMPAYRAILEHVTEIGGSEYLEIIRRESPDILDSIDALKDNDLVGGGDVFDYPGVGRIGPSTLRYIKVASDLRRYFGDEFGCVAEIGVGYGGQLLVSDRLMSIERCDLLDLAPVLRLASKYLEAHVLRGSYRAVTLNQHPGDVTYDLVVSNYAFSELPSALQKRYVEKIMMRAKRGYLTMNSGRPGCAFLDDKLALEDLMSMIPGIEILPERPSTHPGNYIVIWGHRTQVG